VRRSTGGVEPTSVVRRGRRPTSVRVAPIGPADRLRPTRRARQSLRACHAPLGGASQLRPLGHAKPAMPSRRATVLFLAPMLYFAASGADLGDLDRTGRLIAERPCHKPSVSTKAEKSPHDESITNRFVSLRCAKAGSELVRSSSSQYGLTIPLFTSVSHPDPRVPAAFRVGVSLSSVRNRLGTPEVDKPGSVTYLL